MNLLQDADEASLPAILNCMHFLCDNDPAAQVIQPPPPPPPPLPPPLSPRACTSAASLPYAPVSRCVRVQALLSRLGAPRLLAAHLLRSGMQVT